MPPAASFQNAPRPASPSKPADPKPDPVQPPAAAPDAPPKLPPYRAEAIAALTAKGHELLAELLANDEAIGKLHFRQATIRKELVVLTAKVNEHAWDGRPLS